MRWWSHNCLSFDSYLTDRNNVTYKQIFERIIQRKSLSCEMWHCYYSGAGFPMGFPRWCSGKESTCLCRRLESLGFDPWIRKIPWRRAWQAHSTILAWGIPWTEEPGGLQSMQLQRVRHDWAHARAHTHTHTHTTSHCHWVVNLKPSLCWIKVCLHKYF